MEVSLPKLNIPQLNTVIDTNPAKTLMENLLEHHIPVASSCGGDGICGKCKMKILATPQLEPPSKLELSTLEKNNAETGERLSCQIKLTENALVETTYW